MIIIIELANITIVAVLSKIGELMISPQRILKMIQNLTIPFLQSNNGSLS